MNRATKKVRMENRLASNEWLSSNIFGLADIIVLPLVDRMDDLSFAAMWEEDYPRVTDWLKRARLRTSFAQAF